MRPGAISTCAAHGVPALAGTVLPVEGGSICSGMQVERASGRLKPGLHARCLSVAYGICGLGCQPPRNTLKRGHQAASVLVGLLWCVAILSVVVIGVLHSARLNLLVVKNHGDLIQAHYLALAGIEKAKALLYL